VEDPNVVAPPAPELAPGSRRPALILLPRWWCSRDRDVVKGRASGCCWSIEMSSR